MGKIVITTAVFLLFDGIFLFCFFKSRKIYEEYIEPVDKKEYGLKDFLPIGLYFCQKQYLERMLPKKAGAALARYDNKVYGKVLELRGKEYAGYYMMIQRGYRTALGIMLGAGAALIGFIMMCQGDLINGLLFSGLAIAAAVFFPVLADRGLDEKISQRRLQIRLEFPEFINKLTLLVNAGMTISKAWEKIILENKKDCVLYKEMMAALGEIRAGKAEHVAYEEFARRCKTKEVTKFVSVIIMNLRRGGAEIVPILSQQGNECWEMRKAAVRQMGEEAGTKLMLPLMIMFLGIILIVATPAALTFTAGM